MSKRMTTAAATILGLVFALIAQCRAAQPPREAGPAELLAVRVLLEDALWRLGGPDQERIVSLYSRLAGSGDPASLSEACSALGEMLQNHWLGPQAVAELDQVRVEVRLSDAPNPYGLDVAQGLKQSIHLYQLDAEQRRLQYVSSLSAQPGTGKSLLSWETAASLALLEERDDLLPAIESGPAIKTSADEAASSVAATLQYVHIPLAKARRTPDWVQAYCTLILESAGSSNLVNGSRRSLASARVRLALLRLLHKNPPGLRGHLLPIATQMGITIPTAVQRQPAREISDERDIPSLLTRALDLLRDTKAEGAAAGGLVSPSPGAVWSEQYLIERGLLVKAQERPSRP